MVVQESDFIIKEGSSTDKKFFLIERSAAVYYGDTKINTIKAGAYFGKAGCILGITCRAGIIAATTCELQCISKRNINLLLGVHLEVGRDIKRMVRQQMQAVRRSMVDKTTLSRVTQFKSLHAASLKFKEKAAANKRNSKSRSRKNNNCHQEHHKPSHTEWTSKTVEHD